MPFGIFRVRFDHDSTSVSDLKAWFDAWIAGFALQSVPPAPAGHDVMTITGGTAASAETHFPTLAGAEAARDAYRTHVMVNGNFSNATATVSMCSVEGRN